MLTGIILIKNEENNIVDCLESLSFCDETILIDDNSEDRTLELAKNFKVKIYKRSLNDDFSAQRNFGLEKASGDWILFIDADERITQTLKKEILYKIDSKENISGFYIKRKDYFMGKMLNHGETSSIKLLRLIRKGSGNWMGKVHETLIVSGTNETLENPLFHYPHPTISEFLKEINFYSSLRARELYEKRKKVNFFSVLTYPKIKFFLNFFFRKGFLDGIQGFVFALLMSFHSFLVRGKLWLLWQRK